MKPRIDQTAVIGHPPESRDHEGAGIKPLVHPTARIEAFVTVDAGTRHSTFIGQNVWLLKHSHVGHDAYVDDGAEVCTGAVIGGHARVGRNAKIGLNATILPFRIIGAGAVIGAGSVVTKDVPAFETWAGNPARKLEDYERDPRPHTERGHIAV